MAMVNMDILDIIHEIYEDLVNNVILKNVPKDCPNITDIRSNYLFYLVETYKSHKPTGDREAIKDFIISQQKELWSDELVYNIYRNFVYDVNYDRLVKLSEKCFTLADIARQCDITISKEKRDRILSGFTRYVKKVKPCFREYANDFATEGYKDTMYASGDRKEVSDRLKETIDMENGY